MYLCEVREYMGTLRFSAQYCCEPKSLKDKVDQKQTQGVWQLQLEVFRQPSSDSGGLALWELCM